MSAGNDELVRSSFDAFLRGDWDALARVMDPEVQWLWYEPGDWDCHDRKKVLATLFERRREGMVTGLNAVVAADDRVFVEIAGPRHACMVVTVRDGRIVRMQDYPDRAAARAGAGLPPEPERLDPDAPLMSKVTELIKSGEAAELEQLLREHPDACHRAARRPRARTVQDVAARRHRLAGARAAGRREGRGVGRRRR